MMHERQSIRNVIHYCLIAHYPFTPNHQRKINHSTPPISGDGIFCTSFITRCDAQKSRSRLATPALVLLHQEPSVPSNNDGTVFGREKPAFMHRPPGQWLETRLPASGVTSRLFAAPLPLNGGLSTPRPCSQAALKRANLARSSVTLPGA